MYYSALCSTLAFMKHLCCLQKVGRTAADKVEVSNMQIRDWKPRKQHTNPEPFDCETQNPSHDPTVLPQPKCPFSKTQNIRVCV